MKVRVDDRHTVTATIEKPRGFDPASGAVVVLGHGAGNDMESPFLKTFTAGLKRAGHAGVRFNFPCKEQGRKAPNPRPLLEATWRAVLAAVRKSLPGARVFSGGKSMGGRMATYVAAAGGEDLAGLILLGYPLHPAGKPEKKRDDHFPDLRLPALFVTGDRDSLCGLDLLSRSLRRYGGRAAVHVILGGDHSFRVRKTSGRTDEETLEEAIAVTISWIEGRLAGL